MHGNVHILPGPAPWEGAAGHYADLVKAFPELHQNWGGDDAQSATRRWIGRFPDLLAKGWKELSGSEVFIEWSEISRKLFMESHAMMHGSLFQAEYMTVMSHVLDCSRPDLERLQQKSRDKMAVRAWAKLDHPTEELQLVTSAWLLAGLIRGKYHEFFARNNDLQLISHPFRAVIERKLKISTTKIVLNSEQALTKAIIGSALEETTEKRRVLTWIENVSKARKGIAHGAVWLPEAVSIDEAEKFGASAAKKLGIAPARARVSRVCDWAIAIGVSAVVSIYVAPWAGSLAFAAKALVGPTLTQAYRDKFGESFGERVVKSTLSTERRFRSLIRKVPGRIERHLA
jgi:hypothetical protein